MQILLAQQFDGGVFSLAIQFMLADAFIFGAIATGILVRLVDPARIRSIAGLCLSAVAAFSLLIILVGIELFDTWNADFYSAHIAAISVAIILLIESLFRLKRNKHQDAEFIASSNIA